MSKGEKKTRTPKEKLTAGELEALKFPEFVYIYFNKSGKLVIKTDLNRFPKSVTAGVYLFNSMGRVEKKTSFVKDGEGKGD